MALLVPGFLFTIVILNTNISNAAKIVGFPLFYGSQYMSLMYIAEELARRGHEVTLLVGSAQKIQKSQYVKHAVFKVPFDKDFIENHLVKNEIKHGRQAYTMPHGFIDTQKDFCEAALKASDILLPLKSYDLIIADCLMFCGPIIAEYLNISRIEFCPVAPRYTLLYYHHVPAYLSYVPQGFTDIPGNMNFFQRTLNVNVANYVVGVLTFGPIFGKPFDDIKKKYGINPDKSYLESFGDTEMILFLSDHALEYAFPMLPGHKLIGPVNLRAPRPLPPEYEALMTSSGEHGAIIVSFGSNVASILEKREVDVMAEAFGRLKQTVIWRLKGYIPQNMASNIKVVEWMPQTDLLAHAQMRAFVFPCRPVNSLSESAYYGIPVVAVPLFADQPDLAMIVEERGLGLRLDIHSITADHLYSVIQRVLKETGFKANAKRISSLMQDRPRTPVQEAGDWVEYTLRHGRLTHLRPASVHLTWYQYLLLDVILFLVMVQVVVVMVIRLIWKCCCGLCRKRSQKLKTQ